MTQKVRDCAPVSGILNQKAGEVTALTQSQALSLKMGNSSR
jgi:hypothetical protein